MSFAATRMFFAVLGLFVALIGRAGPVQAQMDLGATKKVTAQLIAEQESVQPGKPFWVALKMDITPDWHIYWRNPGDSGMAARIRWDLPAGLTAGPIVWPTPTRIAIPPLLNYGYSDQVLLLTQVTLPVAGPGTPSAANIVLNAKADWLVCYEVCIPESSELTLTLPVAEQEPAPSAWSSAFKTTRQHVPQPLASAVTAIKQDDATFKLTLKNLPLPATDTPVEAYFFSGDPLLVQHSGEQKFMQTDRDISLIVPLNTTTTEHGELFDGNVWVRTTQGEYSFAIQTQIAAPVAAPVPAKLVPVVQPMPVTQPSSFNWLSALGLAFLGGIILNLMPCVFPVLSIKALSLVQKSQHESRRTMALGGLIYVLGVLCTFAVLGGLLLIVQAGGQSVGWGMQLQSPVFVTILVLVLFVIGYSLIGAATFGHKMMGMGQQLTHKNGFAGVFFTGALAVIVATPCTAPFMGGALFFAFTQPWFVAISVLLALGLGLALPYFLLCLFPQALKILPKPGIWMEHFKQFLAFPMFGAAIWLVWVLAQQSGADGVLRALAAILFVTFTLWVWRSVRHDTKRNAWHYTKIVIAVLAALYVVSLVADQRLAVAQLAGPNPVIKASALPYEQYSAQTLDALRQSGQPVFVNMTASWCITCLANERNALSSDRVRDYFRAHNIAYLKGDWTNRDPAISAYLAQNGRNGVPLYVYYAPGAPPRILPQLLTPDLVLKELGQPGV